MAGTTPNIGLNVPDYGDHNWNVPVNQNWNTLDTAIAGKQATLTFDSAPASGSTNPVTSDGIYTGLNTKVDKADLSTVQCVVDTYVSGSSWYRVWSDGWVEQGGFATRSAATQTVTFPKAFVDTNYNVQISPRHTADSTDGRPPLIRGRTKTGFTLNIYTSYEGAYWLACGYGA